MTLHRDHGRRRRSWRWSRCSSTASSMSLVARQEGRGHARRARAPGARGDAAHRARPLGAYLSMHVPGDPGADDRADRLRRPERRPPSTGSTSRRSPTCGPSGTRTSPTRPRSGYFVVRDPDVDDKMDLVRREQTPIDFDPLKGGIVNVVAENVEEFDVRYLDPLTGAVGRDLGLDAGRPASPTGCRSRCEITLVLKGVGDGPPYSYTTKVFLPIQQPLSFGIPAMSRATPTGRRRARGAGSGSAASRSSWCSARSPSWWSCSPSSRTTPAPSSPPRRPRATACRPSTSRGAPSTSRACSSPPSPRCARRSRRSSC